ncbi:MAG: hypothetical protein AAFY28_06040 [Actinomycetota bacterium]
MTSTHSRSSIVSRRCAAAWLCTGAALAAAITVSGAATWSADAAPSDEEATYVATSGCRVFDYRPAPDQVGPRPQPLAAGEVYTQQITGGVGDCVGTLSIPDDAVAVAMNVTAVGATAQTNLRLFPADVTEVPTLSNLNVSAGQAPFPNKVDVALSPDGAIKLFNQNGSVSVLADIVGYYTTTGLADINTRLANLEANDTKQDSAIAANAAAVTAHGSAIAANAATTSDLITRQPFAQQERLDAATSASSPTALVVMELDAPADGHFTLIASSNVYEDTAGQTAYCSISTHTDPTDYDADYLWAWSSSGQNTGIDAVIAGTRVISVDAGEQLSVGYVCGSFSAGNNNPSNFTNTTLSAVFTPAP